MACSSSPTEETFVFSLTGVDTFDGPKLFDVPESVGSQAPLKVSIWYSTGGCEYGFLRWDVKRNSSQLELTPIGYRRPLQQGYSCHQSFDTVQQEYVDETTIERNNPFTVILHRSNGPDIVRSVIVTPSLHLRLERHQPILKFISGRIDTKTLEVLFAVFHKVKLERGNSRLQKAPECFTQI
jgi:hypothetical protein